MVNTGIYLNEGDVFSILATGEIDEWPSGPRNHNMRPELGYKLMYRIGKNFYYTFWRNPLTILAGHSGNLFLGYKDGQVDPKGNPISPSWHSDNIGTFSVDIIVWKEADYTQIGDFFEEMKQKDPENKLIIDALRHVNILKELYIAEAAIEETTKALQALKDEPEGKKGESVKMAKEEKITSQAKPSTGDVEKLERIAQLESELAKLTETLSELEKMKRDLSEEREKSSILTQELEERKEKEKDLIDKLKESSKVPPVIVIASPKDESKVESDFIYIFGVAEDDQGLTKLEIFINNKSVKKEEGRGLRVTGGIKPKRFNINERIPLKKGENQIRIRAVDSDGLWAEKILTIERSKIRRNVWAVIIGINDYPNTRKLKFAVNDAKAFYDHMVRHEL
jgi:hypothetical protein